MTNNDFKKQIDFIIEIDKLKNIFRRSYVMGTERNENDAEHSWHLSMMAIILHMYANEKINLLHVIKMVLIHDIVEIDAGDTFCYDNDGYLDKSDRENAAADRIFSILPVEQQIQFRSIWKEFEKGETAEAKFAQSLDRLMPLLHNFHTQGKAWKEHGITKEMVLNRNKSIVNGSEKLWEYAQLVINDATEKGYLSK